MQSYEVEIKSLLGSQENADALLARMREIDPATKQTSVNKQLNHYFVGGDLRKLAAAVAPVLSAEARAKFEDLAGKAKDFSLRTREKNGTVLLVLKASMGDDTSANGVSRIEFEEKASVSLNELDKILLGAGFSYQAKWSRERQEYAFKGATVCLDHNAGYGWLAEFEKVVGNEDELASADASLRALMAECGVQELPQERLERMFAFYNAHWPEYYGTEEIFVIE
jgi:adenylate cyclase class IV